MSSTVLIKDMPREERPREKLDRTGPQGLSDAELLGLVFRTGREGYSAVDIGRELMRKYSTLTALSRADPAEWQNVSGVGPVKASHLTAIFELGRRMALEAYDSQPVVGPEDVQRLLFAEMKSLRTESMRVVLLDQRRRLITVEEVYRGTRNSCMADPAELLRYPIIHSASYFIVVHNHPSGDPWASDADVQATKKLRKAAETVGIKLADHVIIGSVTSECPQGYFSFKESGFIP